ncbi:galactosyltransferase [Histoplasma capsulatum var. duboisii H88]|uniref:Galactosyltransferase n=4 Tax=Ajellomyces capsulatus TaxID=5037 RepID=C0P0T4_AJECG|nr:galactosyltransferase [Histoplasma capsulatum G186AR]EER36993.1 galactosyltransferase [Histoplasma capsulatum H143]EGC40684.1 galactosyltransferase [Histoplasma capsulatum var. duboisii H88]KAG5287300.1 galactosyltransferase [Histoplasma capsulatum]EEH02734.1 galactosyltransferase [Histoplasma capsulatum G186AR]QSS52882.1 galactosyltransferase [Histoplasma capsulatum var. duboisii H88]
MSLSRSPSPRRGGGWSSPGLTIATGSSRGSSPPRGYHDTANSSTSSGSGAFHPNSSPIAGAGPGNGAVTWASAKAKSDRIAAYPSFSTRNNGFFSRQRRKISASLPRFRVNSMLDYGEKEKLGRGRWLARGPGDLPLRVRLKTLLGSLIRRKRFRFMLLLLFLFFFWLFFSTRIIQSYRASSMGGGKKIVLVVGANIGGGVMEWKGAREWAIERDSLKNKRKYVQRWGYELEIVNMVTQKRYAHEWREGWEKVDALRQAFRRYPNAEWFWWLDLHTYIMEPTYSLQSHVLNHLDTNAYRDINFFNPLNISHPLNASYLDPFSRSITGDNKTSSINMILTQDCSGFSLGSFVVRRSPWTERLLDIWWDPALYEQKHLAWTHKEQDSLQHVYINHPWVRPHVAFMPQRRMNSFPPGACGNGTDRRIHYQRNDRDFIVNMAGCEWGRDCWGEMWYYRQLGYFLNRSWWERFKEGLADIFFKMIGRPLKRQF